MDLYLQFVFAGLTIGGIYALVGAGFSFIYYVTTVLNFSQGEFLMVGAMLAVTLTSGLGLPLPWALIAAVLLVAALGAAFEILGIRPVGRRGPVHLILVTIGASVLLQGAAVPIWGKDYHGLPGLGPAGYLRVAGATLPVQALWILAFTAAIVGGLMFFFNRTLIGKGARACAENRVAASLLGIDVRRMSTVAFSASAGLGALAGVLVAPISLIYFQGGTILAVKGICSAVLGGLGNVWGAFVGGILLGLLESLVVGLVSSEFKDAVAFVLLLAILVVRPSGLLGRPGG